MPNRGGKHRGGDLGGRHDDLLASCRHEQSEAMGKDGPPEVLGGEASKVTPRTPLVMVSEPNTTHELRTFSSRHGTDMCVAWH